VIATLKGASKNWLKRALRGAFGPSLDQTTQVSPEHWGLQRDDRGQLRFEPFALNELCGRFGSPVHVVSAGRLRDNARRFLAVPARARAGCEVFYSYKTNPVPHVLSELHALGIGAEVISPYELWLALRLGVPANKIVYNGPAKSPESIRQALDLGIQLLNLNHREEIALVAGMAAQMHKRARVGLRVTLGGWAGQFGTPVAGGQALQSFAAALKHDSLQVVALHVHRGGMIHSAAELRDFVREVLKFADDLRQQLGLQLEVIDLGGSLGSPSVRSLATRELRLNRTFFKELEAPDPNRSLGIDAYVAELLELVQRHYRDLNLPLPRVFIEPGRALTSDAQLLLCRVLGLKETPEQTYAILDAGINLADSCRSEYHHILLVDRDGPPRSRPYTLVGPICTPGDTLRWAVRLPELAAGDTLAIMDSGAYFVPFATSFSFPQPAVVMLDERGVQQIRRAETFDDLISYDEPSCFSGDAPRVPRT
jgi:diaminopimelate decarboxylase